MKKQNRHRRSRMSPLWPAVCLLCLMLGYSAGRAAAQHVFERHEVVTGPGTHQTVLTGDLLGGPADDLAVIDRDPDGKPRLRIHALRDGRWSEALTASLRSDAEFVDVLGTDDRERLIVYGGGEITWFDPGPAAERSLLNIEAGLAIPERAGIPHVDITRDVNGDGRADLVVPAGVGFRVLVRRADGSFSEPLLIGLSDHTDPSMRTGGYRYFPWLRSRIHRIDYDRDGRPDLVLWKDGRFEAHLQNDDGIFNKTPVTFDAGIAFDTDDPDELAAPAGVRRRRKDEGVDGKMTGRVLHSLTDIDGDGTADLVVLSLEGGSLWKMRSVYEVHFGEAKPDERRTVFAPEPGAVIRSDGILFGLERHDLDGDGRADAMVTLINPGFFKVVGMLVGAVLTRSVSLDVRFHRLENGVYPEKPAAARKIRTVSLGSGERSALFPAVLIGDVTGDGRPDLLVQKGRKQLRLYAGVPGPDLFARRPQKIRTRMPASEFHTWLADPDRDGRKDVVMHLRSAEGPHRVAILFSR